MSEVTLNEDVSKLGRGLRVHCNVQKEGLTEDIRVSMLIPELMNFHFSTKNEQT